MIIYVIIVEKCLNTIFAIYLIVRIDSLANLAAPLKKKSFLYVFIIFMIILFIVLRLFLFIHFLNLNLIYKIKNIICTYNYYNFYKNSIVISINLWFILNLFLWIIYNKTYFLDINENIYIYILKALSENKW
jgi:hypothetical protein